MALLNNLTVSSRIQVGVAWVGVAGNDHMITADKTPKQNQLENYGSLLVWDAAMPQLKPLVDKYIEKQRTYQ